MHNRNNKTIHYYDSLPPIQSKKEPLKALAYIVFFITLFSFAYFSINQTYIQCNQGDVAACMILSSN